MHQPNPLQQPETAEQEAHNSCNQNHLPHYNPPWMFRSALQTDKIDQLTNERAVPVRSVPPAEKAGLWLIAHFTALDMPASSLHPASHAHNSACMSRNRRGATPKRRSKASVRRVGGNGHLRRNRFQRQPARQEHARGIEPGDLDEAGRRFPGRGHELAMEGAFPFTRPFATTVLANTLAFWNREEFGIPIEPGMDEVSLVLVADAWSRTYRSKATTLAAGTGAVQSRNGMRIIPDRPGMTWPEARPFAIFRQQARRRA